MILQRVFSVEVIVESFWAADTLCSAGGPYSQSKGILFDENEALQQDIHLLYF